MKKFRRILAFLVLCALIGISVFLYDKMGIGKSDEELIKERVEKFTDAYNSGNFEEAVESMDAKTRNTAKAVMNIGEGLFGGYTGYNIQGSDLFTLGVAISGDDELLKIQLANLSVEGASAMATGVLSYGAVQIEADFSFIKEGRDWYIKNIEETDSGL